MTDARATEHLSVVTVGEEHQVHRFVKLGTRRQVDECSVGGQGGVERTEGVPVSHFGRREHGSEQLVAPDQRPSQVGHGDALG